jgi:hypothetical protein
MVAEENIETAKVSNHNNSVLAARIAGLLYLIIIVCGIFSEVYVRMNLIVPRDAEATAVNVLASPHLFQMGFVADSIMVFCDVAIAILFYVLLKEVNKTLALIAAVFRFAQAVILGANLIHYYAAYLLLGDGAYGHLGVGNSNHGLMMFFLDLHKYGYDLGLLFFAISNLFLGFLIIRSYLFPSFFGYALQLSAVVYLVGGYCRFVFPQYMDVLQPAYVIPFVAELSFCLWLLIIGVRAERRPTGGSTLVAGSTD